MAMKTKSELASLIKLVGVHHARLDAEIQTAVQTVLYYNICHGEYPMANDLLNVIPKGSRRNAIVLWLETNGKFRWDRTAKALTYFDRSDLFYRPEENMTVPIKELLNNPESSEAYVLSITKHWDASEKTKEVKSAYDELDILKRAFTGLISMNKKAEKEGKPVQHPEIMGKIKALYAEYSPALVSETEAEEVEAAEWLAGFKKFGKKLGIETPPVIKQEIASVKHVTEHKQAGKQKIAA